MKINSSAFLAILLQTCVSGQRIKSQEGKIIGGRNARVGEFPYQVSLQEKNYFKKGTIHFCGGAIIDEYHVLTAGHCVYGYEDWRLRVSYNSVYITQGIDPWCSAPRTVSLYSWDQLRVVAGVLNVTDTSDPARVNLTLAHIYLHKGYVDETLLNDIALIRVNGEFPLSSPVISAIPLRKDRLSPPATCTVSGWGITRMYPDYYPDILQALDVPLISLDVCVASYEDYGGIDPGMFCAGFMTGGKDSCDGDSGGPLQCEGLLTGILSWGNDCALPKYPAVYTEVAYYKKWIKNTLAKSVKDGGLTPPFFPKK